MSKCGFILNGSKQGKDTASAKKCGTRVRLSVMDDRYEIPTTNGLEWTIPRRQAEIIGCHHERLQRHNTTTHCQFDTLRE